MTVLPSVGEVGGKVVNLVAIVLLSVVKTDESVFVLVDGRSVEVLVTE